MDLVSNKQNDTSSYRNHIQSLVYLNHLVDGVKLGGADAVLAASIFHFGEYSIRDAKDFMKQHSIEIR